MDNIDKVRMELAHKYYALAEVKPDLKVDLFSSETPEIDLNRIQRVACLQDQAGRKSSAWRPSTDKIAAPERHATSNGNGCGWRKTVRLQSGIWRPRCLPMCCKRGQSVGEQKQEEQVRQQNEAVAKNRPEANDENMFPHNGSFGTTSRKSIPTPCI